MVQTLDMFLTAYDPSDLPGGSVDPLGFDRGYTFLADSILPGMTNVASRPRYISVLCTGVFLGDNESEVSSLHKRENRRECALRLERLWALANVLASQRAEISSSGIRGITYVISELDRIARMRAPSASASYKLLARQQQYGVFGVYGAVAEGMRFLDRRTLLLTPDAGMKLADRFINETKLPPSIRKAIQSDDDHVEVDIDILTDWGERAHVNKEPEKGEAELIREALHRDPTRSRTIEMLANFPWRDTDGEDDQVELRRIDRIASQLDPLGIDRDFRVALLAIIAFEKCYRLAMFIFERVLYLCHAAPSGILKIDSLSRDEILNSLPVSDELDLAAEALTNALEELRGTKPTLGFERIKDVHRFVQCTCSAVDIVSLVRAVIARHADVQHGKFDRGRRKMPWVEETSSGISLTMTRVSGIGFEVTHPEKIRPHFYRLGSAEMFHRQGGTT